MMRFDELSLDPLVLKALNEMGYETASEIQEKAIPILLQGTDFLGQAPTGTGKTAAFGIPLISRLEPGPGNTDALIIGPTRELVIQITDELNRIAKYKDLRIVATYGGESVFAQKETIREQRPRVVVGTPGRVLDLIRQVVLDFTQTRLLILDEADEMLDMGFLPDIETIFKEVPMGRETWLFSATISSEIKRIADQHLFYPQEVRIQPQVMSAERIKQYYYIAEDEEKHRVLRKLFKSEPDMYGIIFCQTKRDVVLLARKLRDDFPLDCLHGAMEQSDRNKVMEAFRERKLRLIVATDVMARGIDVDNLTHVINFEPPQDPESYIHRIGRTARMGEQGVAITLFTPRQKRALEWLERKVKMPLQPHPDNTLEFVDAPEGERRGRRDRRRGGGKVERRTQPRAQAEEQVASEGGAPRRRNRRRRRSGGNASGESQTSPSPSS